MCSGEETPRCALEEGHRGAGVQALGGALGRPHTQRCLLLSWVVSDSDSVGGEAALTLPTISSILQVTQWAEAGPRGSLWRRSWDSALWQFRTLPSRARRGLRGTARRAVEVETRIPGFLLSSISLSPRLVTAPGGPSCPLSWRGAPGWVLNTQAIVGGERHLL